MPHAKVGALVHLKKSDIAPSDLFLLKRRLIVVPKSTAFDPSPKPIVCFLESDEHISIPRAFFFENKTKEYTFENLYSSGDSLQDLSRIRLRPEQIPVVKAMEKHFESGNLQGVIESGTGTGKTVMGLELSRRLGGTTLIKVHKDPLAEQWIDEIKKFFPEAKIGRIQGDTLDYKGKDFVITMVQTVDSRKEEFLRNKELRNYFRTEIVDECHRMGSREWGATAYVFNNKYRIGLTATPERNDGCEKVFRFHLGDTVAKLDATNLEPVIYYYDSLYKDYNNYSINTKPVFVQLKILANNKLRNRRIVDKLIGALKTDRNIIVMSKYVDHLETLKKMTDARLYLEINENKEVKLLNKKTSFFIGALNGEKKADGKIKKIKLKKEELEEAKKADILFATYKMAEDAFNLPKLDTLFMALPIKDPRQAIGRILRKTNYEKKPIVIDITDEFISFCSSLRKIRSKIYDSKGWRHTNGR